MYGLVLWPILNQSFDEKVDTWYLRPFCSIAAHRAEIGRL